MDQLASSSVWHPFSLNRQDKQQTFAFWDGAFEPKELKKLCEYGDSLTQQEASVSGSDDVETTHSVRACQVAWIRPSEESIWIFQRLNWVVTQLNRDYFGFDLSGISSFQYTIYDAEKAPKPGAFYDWHSDNGVVEMNDAMRKLTIVMQLSDPQEYEGGELWMHGAMGKQVIPKVMGHIIAFPSYTLHRVTPVTAGIRKSLVAWYVGPQFR